jgi:hypothetical protein
MSRKTKAAVSVFGLGLAATLWLNVGVCEDREWGAPSLFSKYRPSPKVVFYAPLGEASPSSVPGHEGYLTAKQQREEEAFVEFVERRSRR